MFLGVQIAPNSFEFNINLEAFFKVSLNNIKYVHANDLRQKTRWKYWLKRFEQMWVARIGQYLRPMTKTMYSYLLYIF